MLAIEGVKRRDISYLLFAILPRLWNALAHKAQLEECLLSIGLSLFKFYILSTGINGITLLICS